MMQQRVSCYRMISFFTTNWEVQTFLALPGRNAMYMYILNCNLNLRKGRPHRLKKTSSKQLKHRDLHHSQVTTPQDKR